MDLDNTKEVAQVSEPLNSFPVTSTPSSHPIEIASLNAFSAPGGPIEITIALPPCSSFNWIPTSIAYRSRGFIMLSTPSLIIVPVFSSIFTLLVSGTCLIGIIMFNFSPSTVVFISLYNSSYKNMSYG
ncbi:hypothetical protein ES703_83670 [subsurface metagenome]